MGLSTFRGGAHPYEGKSLSENRPIKTLEAGDVLVFPMSQHIGAPATPVVEVGDEVKMGQLIGEASGFISANIVSSVSGKVTAIEPRLLSSGAKATCVVIENDKNYTPIDGLGTERDYKSLDAATIRRIIKDAGIVGMGGAGFPTNVKVTPKNEDQIDHVIINGAECEPYLTSDYRLMLERPEELIEGLRVVLSIFKNAKGVIAIEDNKPEAIEKLSYLTESDPNIEIKRLKTKYPQGAERQIIYVTTGRRLHAKLLPADVGCIVDNVQTMLAIYDAVVKSTPSMTRVMTMTGEAMADPQNYLVRFGMSHAEVLEKAGGLKAEGAAKLISGGPMMGMAMFDLETPITKTSSSILALSEDEVRKNEPSNCIRCGRCASVCPCHLVPQMMAQAGERGDLEAFEALNGMECYECGTCTFVCPAKRRLTQTFKQCRQAVMAKNRAAQAKAAEEKKKAEEAKAAEEEKKAEAEAAADDKGKEDA
ncbi:MAG TPA: electron transport complex subunit RsxC [Lachnospiraceae bacterium]|nr:electron transport complex subunit RsxC [Lachnospiraceae bacterium]